MDHLQSLRLGPGVYEPKQVRDDACMVDYKMSMKVVEKRVNIDRMDREDIGPGYYYAKDDYVKPKLLGFKIVPHTEDPMKEFNEIDRREPLDINYEATEKRLAGGLINPQSTIENPMKYIQLLEDARTVRYKINLGTRCLHSRI